MTLLLEGQELPRHVTCEANRARLYSGQARQGHLHARTSGFGVERSKARVRGIEPAGRPPCEA